MDVYSNIDTHTFFTYNVQLAGKTLYTVYTPPQYTVVVQVKDANTGKAIVGASVYMNGIDESGH